jgi:hypothetical protein
VVAAKPYKQLGPDHIEVNMDLVHGLGARTGGVAPTLEKDALASYLAATQ